MTEYYFVKSVKEAFSEINSGKIGFYYIRDQSSWFFVGHGGFSLHKIDPLMLKNYPELNEIEIDL